MKPGELWERDVMLGDWFGLRSWFANRGIQFDRELSLFYQGILPGSVRFASRRVLKRQRARFGNLLRLCRNPLVSDDANVQIIDPALKEAETAAIVGLRARLVF